VGKDFKMMREKSHFGKEGGGGAQGGGGGDLSVSVAWEAFGAPYLHNDEVGGIWGKEEKD